MRLRKIRSLRTATAVVFTSLVLPVLINMATLEATNCQKALHQALEGEPTATTVAEPPRGVQPPRATTGNNQAESSSAKTLPVSKIEEWLSAGAPRGW